MSIETLRKLLEDDGLSLDTEEALQRIIGSRTSGELKDEEEQKVRAVLTWEAESLDTKADFYEDLAQLADNFSAKVEAEVPEPDFDVMIGEFVEEEEKEIDNLKKVLDARIDLIGSDL